MARDDGGGGDAKKIESRLTTFLGPYEPLIMKIQSLLVWEYPWKSAILLAFTNLLFWFVYVSSLRFFFLVSIVLILIVFIDTWKNRIWPEIRVPAKEPEDKDGWTPVHPRLLSVPEISNLLSDCWQRVHVMFNNLRSYRSSHPLVFCLGNTAFFTVTAVVGCHISGCALAYLSIMSLMLWPSVMYHSLPSKAYKRLEPGLQWLGANITKRLRVVFDAISGLMPSFLANASGDGEVEEEFFPQESSEVAAALSKAIGDSEDDNGTSSSIPTPGLSTAPSLNNSEEDSLDQTENEADFELEVNQMPSFDDLDNTDDELDLPSKIIDSLAANVTQSNLNRLSALQFSAGHFGDSESEDEHTLSENVDFSDSNNAGPSQSALQNIGGAFVARTISSMMESALQGVAYLGQGQKASSSSVIPRTGAKITYTCTDEGESIDFQNPHATILESEEEVSDLEQNEHIAEIEKDFDFLHDLEYDS